MRIRALLLLLSAAAIRCGSTMPGEVTADHRPFDYAHPPCTRSLQPAQANEADIRYLGSGGVFISWRGSAILLGPFFTNTPFLANIFGRFHHDRARIAEHLRGVPLPDVRAILTGHSHYDHFGDVPVVAAAAPGAAIYANASGVAKLAAYPELRERAHAVAAEVPITIADAGGAAVMRIRPVASDHAPQLCRSRRLPCNFYNCPGLDPWTSGFESHTVRDFCGGDPFAYVIDLLDARGAPAFRIYYNDAAPEAPLGIPAADGVPYDVAILCVASYDHVDGYPEALLRAIRPRHVLLTHYEDFFSKSEGQWHFVGLFTDAKAKRFVERMAATGAIQGGLTPVQPVCGATGTGWTMPVPREQARFAAEH